MNLSQSEISRLASFPEQNPNPVIEISFDGTITYSNPASKKYFPDLIQKPHSHPILEKALEHLKSKSLSNTKFEIQVNETVFEQKINFLTENNIVRIFCTDITEQKQIQKNLARLASFPEQNPSPIIELDLNGNITYYNPACINHFPEITSHLTEHQVLKYFKENFSKFLSGEVENYSIEIKIGEKYYAQRARLLKEYAVIRIFNIDISEQKRTEQIIRDKNKDITDSINYAKRIQEAILPSSELLHFHFQDSFIFYKPKDIISGDFYWFAGLEDLFVIACADCTGHGVPGALMSMIGSNLISQIVTDSKIQSPGDALSALDIRVRKSLNQDNDTADSTHDGMDIAMCAIRKTNNILQYAGAHRPLVFFKNNQIAEIPASKFPIGGQLTSDKFFSTHEIKLEENDVFYLYSDGIADQFGGPRGKKITKKNFYLLLQQIHQLPMYEQKEKIRQFFDNWKGDLEQLDDVLVIGIRYKN